MFTWLPMPHMPHPPKEILDRAKEMVTETQIKFADWDFKDQWRSGGNELLLDGNIIHTRRNQRVDFPEYAKWVSANITDQWIKPPDAAPPGLRVSLGKPEWTVHGAHCDNPDSWAFLYIIDNGSSGRVETKFWRQKGYPIERFGATKGNGIICNNFDDLILLDSTSFPKQPWVLINTTILHSVHGHSGPRANLSIRIPAYSIKLKPVRA